jgi:hypothetical protein
MRCHSLVVFSLWALTSVGLSPAVGGEAKEDAKSLKGWELYARFDAEQKAWRFGLLRGTNRQKAAKEVADSLIIEGMKALRKELSRLAEGETVLLQSRLPDEARKEVENLCTKAKLKFVDAGR